MKRHKIIHAEKAAIDGLLNDWAGKWNLISVWPGMGPDVYVLFFISID